jgi:NAD+ diphosphatase
MARKRGENMRDIEFAFSGAGLDRAAHLRSDPDQWVAARILPIWQGKVLLDQTAQRLAWVDAAHTLSQLADLAVFLGIHKQTPYFAIDVSSQDMTGVPQSDGFLDDTTQTHPSLPDHLQFVELRQIMTQLPALDGELAATARAITGWHASHGFCAKCGGASAPAMAGWERHCQSCGAVHFPRTDPVVIMLVTHGNQVLMGRSPGWPDGMYSLLAGFVEPGETVEAAVRRETMEEAGIKVGNVRYLASQPWPFPASLMIGCWGQALGTEITLDPNELEGAIWMTREQVLQSFADPNAPIRPARKGAIAYDLIRNWLADTL